MKPKKLPQTSQFKRNCSREARWYHKNKIKPVQDLSLGTLISQYNKGISNQFFLILQARNIFLTIQSLEAENDSHVVDSSRVLLTQWAPPQQAGVSSLLDRSVVPWPQFSLQADHVVHSESLQSIISDTSQVCDSNKTDTEGHSVPLQLAGTKISISRVL